MVISRSTLALSSVTTTSWFSSSLVRFTRRYTVEGLLELNLMAKHSESSSASSIEKPSSRNSEQTVNFVLGNIIRTKNVRWKEAIETEKTQMIVNSPDKRPDIVVSHPGGLPVVIETEFAPARTVEDDARTRLGNTLTKDNRQIEQTVAVCIPESFITEYENRIFESLESAIFKYCMFIERTGVDSTHLRWPEKGWIEGGIDDLVGFIE